MSDTISAQNKSHSNVKGRVRGDGTSEATLWHNSAGIKTSAGWKEGAKDSKHSYTGRNHKQARPDVNSFSTRVGFHLERDIDRTTVSDIATRSNVTIRREATKGSLESVRSHSAFADEGLVKMVLLCCLTQIAGRIDETFDIPEHEFVIDAKTKHGKRNLVAAFSR